MSLDGEGDEAQGLRIKEEDTELDLDGKEHLLAQRDLRGQGAVRTTQMKGC